MKMKYEAVPVYAEVEVAAKTVASECGTIDRRAIGRCLLTEDEGFKADNRIVCGDETPIVSVSKLAADTELFVELVGGIRSLASFKVFADKAWTAANKENADVSDVYTTDSSILDRIRACAARMSESHPECDGQWKIVDASGNRVFVRLVVVGLTANGMVDVDAND